MTLVQNFNSQFNLMQNIDFAVRIIVSALAGGVIGYERSHRFKEAGIRTHVIVCCTTALVMIISKYGFVDLIGPDGSEFNGTRGADAARVAAQAVSGISFLCAGV
ncbi:MAG: MgtC/SapB family protein, partial [Lachnospiraceae bacterium]|nr:MgtC/SapB family protein [Lachnospiraceae bacterium]